MIQSPLSLRSGFNPSRGKIRSILRTGGVRVDDADIFFQAGGLGPLDMFLDECSSSFNLLGGHMLWQRCGIADKGRPVQRDVRPVDAQRRGPFTASSRRQQSSVQDPFGTPSSDTNVLHPRPSSAGDATGRMSVGDPGYLSSARPVCFPSSSTHPIQNHHFTPPRLFLFWILDKPAPRARVRLFQIRGSTRHRLFLMIQLCPAPKHLPAAQHLRCNPSKAARVISAPATLSDPPTALPESQGRPVRQTRPPEYLKDYVQLIGVSTVDRRNAGEKHERTRVSLSSSRLNFWLPKLPWTATLESDLQQNRRLPHQPPLLGHHQDRDRR
ncbi:hypothetical protein HPB47_022601 [Ixodes persulcatus]|uniref:Uncharacterized protein n=1 Tax=Ixodes persulcatus TaxID=34615 RepID=A0AC60Q9C3_IXOPE|nr:hypothetical protein HPB47_022601 [Ixodes persulcatus]